MRKEVYVIGAGTYGEVMCELAELLNYKVLGFYDDDVNKFNKKIMGKEVKGRFSDLKSKDIVGKQFIVAIGNNRVRFKMMTKINQLGGVTPTLIHPSAVISSSVTIGKGVYIQGNTFIWTNVKIGDFSIISPNVVIAHHTEVGKACLISTLSGVGASIKINNRVFIGMGSTLVTGVRSIGEDSIIGAGAVVLENTEANHVYAGIPAKKVRKIVT